MMLSVQKGKYEFVTESQFLTFLDLLHDESYSFITDGIKRRQSDIVAKCLEKLGKSKKLRDLWKTNFSEQLLEGTLSEAALTAALEEIVEIFLKSKQQMTREKLDLKPQKKSIAHRQDLRCKICGKKSRPTNKSARQTLTKNDKRSNLPNVQGKESSPPHYEVDQLNNQEKEFMEKMRKDLSDPQHLLACLKELSEQSNRKKMLSYLNRSKLTKILKALGKPSRNKKEKRNKFRH